MKANELMIGDWARIGELDKYAGHIVKIKSLIYHRDYEAAYLSALVYGDKTVGMTEVCSDDIEPIPLTPEILEKNDFALTNYEPSLGVDSYKGYCYCDKEMMLDAMPVRLNNNSQIDYYHIHFVTRHSGSMQVRPIKFVHELQHALRLCGIEKEIIL